MTVLVLGSINLDMVVTVEALPRPGETVLAESERRSPGGKGCNQAIAAARMGASTAMIGAVGDDEAGAFMLHHLAANRIDVDGVVRYRDIPTGLARIAVDRHGENQIIVIPGANRNVSPGQIAHVGAETNVVLAQLEVPVAAIAAIFGAAAGRLHILNAAPAIDEGAKLFAATDVLIVNQLELAWYAGLAVAPINAQEALAARRLITRADQVVVVTLGAAGCIAVRADSHVFVPAFPTKVVDTTGAGDCFCGALAALLDEGSTIEDALTFANAAAALCVQQPGAGSAMPKRAEVNSLVAAAGRTHRPE